MKSLAVCTSFNLEGYKTYGRRFIESFLIQWPERVKLWVHSEEAIPFPDHPRVQHARLDRDPDHEAFVAYARSRGGDHPIDYKRQPIKFCHKVYAFTGLRPMTDWWVWLDGDVITTKKVTEGWISKVFADDREILYLGRPNAKHSETGFMAWRTELQGPSEMLCQMRDFMNAHRVFDLEQWHDSMVFDTVLKEGGYKATSLSTRPSGHVWPDTVLGEVTTHCKGPDRKRKAYGSSP